MDIIIIDGYQYLDFGDSMFVPLMNAKGEHVKEDQSVRRWIKGKKEGEYLLLQGRSH